MDEKRHDGIVTAQAKAIRFGRPSPVQRQGADRDPIAEGSSLRRKSARYGNNTGVIRWKQRQPVRSLLRLLGIDHDFDNRIAAVVVSMLVNLVALQFTAN
jgi:hypothetical protein